MNDTEKPIEGALFRQNYCRLPHAVSDSKRARRRIYQLFRKEKYLHLDFANDVQSKLGLNYPAGNLGYYHHQFWEEEQLKDFLSAITLFINLARRSNVLNTCRIIFREEQLRYTIDDLGGVHYSIDETFEANIASTLDGLGNSKYNAARSAFETAVEQLNSESPSGKQFIRNIYEAVETVFLLTVGSKGKLNRLNGNEIETHLIPILKSNNLYPHEPDDHIERYKESFKAWVKSAHPYRHGANTEEVHECPIDEAVLIGGIGMNFLGYLIAIDRRNTGT